MATTFTKSGTKASSEVKLSKEVFGLKVESHELIKQAYTRTLDNRRTNNATTLTRGNVRGGGRKPWRQKGTGRARAGSIRSPLWRTGGVTFGPDGTENYSKKLSKQAKRTATKQALSLANADKKVHVIDEITTKGKTSEVAALLKKLGAERTVLIVVDEKSDELTRSTNNLPSVTLSTASYLTVYDILNADFILMTKKAVTQVETWLGGKNA